MEKNLLTIFVVAVILLIVIIAARGVNESLRFQNQRLLTSGVNKPEDQPPAQPQGNQQPLSFPPASTNQDIEYQKFMEKSREDYRAFMRQNKDKFKIRQ